MLSFYFLIYVFLPCILICPYHPYISHPQKTTHASLLPLFFLFFFLFQNAPLGTSPTTAILAGIAPDAQQKKFFPTPVKEPAAPNKTPYKSKYSSNPVAESGVGWIKLKHPRASPAPPSLGSSLDPAQVSVCMFFSVSFTKVMHSPLKSSRSPCHLSVNSQPVVFSFSPLSPFLLLQMFTRAPPRLVRLLPI